MADQVQNNPTFEGHKRMFTEFLEEAEDGKYVEKLKQTMSDGRFRLVVGLNDLRQKDRDFTAQLIQKPREYMLALQEVAAEVAQDTDPSAAKLLKTRELQVGFEDSLGDNAVTPRGLVSTLLNKLVVVEGIVTKCSTSHPKLVKAVQYCPTTGKHTSREFRDATSLDIGLEVRGRDRIPTSSIIPQQDEAGNHLELEQGLCQYKDYQTVVLQEMPERSQVGQLPRSVDVILEHDLVDRVKPGDRVQCVGVYRPLGASASVGNKNGAVSGIFRTVLIANNISVIGKEIGAVKLTGKDVGNIRDIASRANVLDLLATSLAPSIFGLDYVKKALILQLLGGCERNLENGTHLRGDINVMMVGDPSTAKSQLLRSVIDIAPLAISTTGRGSSGVGLTAAVTSDPETGERRLEAGATVLADRGIVCVDEFDKMSENDRVAIHEVMEQQTVTIAKAGIHASLNARCSVLAAANPVYGQYDRTRRPQENIGLPDSLLSRFDLLFIVLDQLDPVSDRRLSEHVIRSHQYRRPGTIMEPEPLYQTSLFSLDDPSDSSKNTSVWSRGGQLHSTAGDFLTKDFLRKFMHYAKNKQRPVLSDVAMAQISEAYTQMRAKQTRQNLPVTARSLETLIRLSSAHAKARLSAHVEECDVEVAVELINYVLYGELGSSAPPPALVSSSSSNQQSIAKNRGSKRNGDELDGATSDEDDDTPNKKKSTGQFKSVSEASVATSIDQYAEIQKILNQIRDETGQEVLSFNELMTRLTRAIGRVSVSEVKVLLNQMERQNLIMFDSDEIHIL